MAIRMRVTGLIVLLLLSALAPAQTFTTIYTFTGLGGAFPYPGVIRDSAGNLYGTAAGGSFFDLVYELNSAGSETVLYRFSAGPNALITPHAPVVMDKAGDIYGTGSQGGSNYLGDVFAGAGGQEKTLYSFMGKSDGCYPLQGLVLAPSGTLYGTTSACGSSGNGTIFKVDSAGKFTVLHHFSGYPSDGSFPANGHLTMDGSGNLYGLTESGGAYGNGALYQLSPNGTITLLHSFRGSDDGCSPFGSVARDKSGNFYGTTAYCGSHGAGTIWKVNQEGQETILHQFAGGKSDGCNPYAGVSRDPKGNLYGVTDSCGTNDYGVLYELSAQGKLTLLHSFDFSDGSDPDGEVLRTSTGTIYGTTAQGADQDCSQFGCGTVWSYVP